jgi:phenylacetate-CoA ligase
MKTTQIQEINKRIKYVVSLSKQIPWYAKKYKELGINPDTIKTPQDLLKAYEKGFYTTPQDLPNLMPQYPVFGQYFLTSGSVGKPKIVALSSDDKERLIREYTPAWKTFIKEGDIILTLLPSSPAISGVTVTESFSKMPVKVFHLPLPIGKDVNTFLEYWKLFKPNSLMGLTTSVYRLPLLLTEKGMEAKQLGIKKIGVGAESSTVERRKRIAEEFDARVYDFYATSENGLIGYEKEPFSDDHLITIPETLVFLVKGEEEVSKNENSEVIVTNLYRSGEKPLLPLINYKIGDWAKCIEKDEESGVVTVIGEIRREAAYLAGAKLNPQEVEAVIDGLGEFKGLLSGEYCIINYNDTDRKAVAEIRLEAKKPLTSEQKTQISQQVRQKIYEANIPVYHMAEIVKDAKLIINITEPGSLYKGYEHLIKPGKPKRLITL